MTAAAVTLAAIAVIVWQRREIARLTVAVDYLRSRLREAEARLWLAWETR